GDDFALEQVVVKANGGSILRSESNVGEVVGSPVRISRGRADMDNHPAGNQQRRSDCGSRPTLPLHGPSPCQFDSKIETSGGHPFVQGGTARQRCCAACSPLAASDLSMVLLGIPAHCTCCHPGLRTSRPAVMESGWAAA